jgi:hypothetical protein
VNELEFGKKLANPHGAWKTCSMLRDLVWLENERFAAWGCKACNWIMQPSVPSDSGKPSTQVKEAFNKHECAKFPRILGKRDARKE